MLSNYYVNPNNKKQHAIIKQEFTEFINNEQHKKALKEIPKNKLSIYQKLILLNINNLKVLKLLTKTKKIIKKIQGKNNQKNILNYDFKNLKIETLLSI